MPRNPNTTYFEPTSEESDILKNVTFQGGTSVAGGPSSQDFTYNGQRMTAVRNQGEGVEEAVIRAIQRGQSERINYHPTTGLVGPQNQPIEDWQREIGGTPNAGPAGATPLPGSGPMIDTGSGPRPFTPGQGGQSYNSPGQGFQTPQITLNNISGRVNELSTNIAAQARGGNTNQPAPMSPEVQRTRDRLNAEANSFNNPENNGVETRGGGVSSLMQEIGNLFPSAPNRTSLESQYNSLPEVSQVQGLEGDLANTNNSIRALEDQVASQVGKISEQGGISNVFAARAQGKIKQDVVDQYNALQRQKELLVNQIQNKNSVISTIMNLKKSDYDAARSEYEFNVNKAFQMYSIFSKEQDRADSKSNEAINRARADSDVIINTIKSNPEGFQSIDPETESQWDRLDMQAGRPQGFIKSLASGLANSPMLSDFEYKGTVGSAETGYSTILFNPKTGETKTVRSVSSVGSTTPDITTSFGKEYQGQAAQLLSAVKNLRFTTVEESKRIIGNIQSRLNQGDIQGAEEELKLFGYQKLKGQQLSDYDLYEGGINAFDQALSELNDPDLTAGPYKTLLEKAKPWLSIQQDQKFLSLKQTIELGQAQIRKAYYGTAVSEREGFNADKFLINESDSAASIKTKLQNSTQFLKWTNDNTIAKSVNLPKPKLSEYMNDISPDSRFPVGSTRTEDGYLWMMGSDGLWEAIGSSQR